MDQEHKLLREASKIYSHALQVEKECSKKRTWISRNWPEKKFLSFGAPTIPEELVRNATGPSTDEMLQNLVQTNIQKLCQGDYVEQQISYEELRDMGDVELVKALPDFIGCLRFSWVQSLHSALHQEIPKKKHRPFIEKELLQAVRLAFMAETRDDVVPEQLNPLVTTLRALIDEGEGLPVGRERYVQYGRVSFLEGIPQESWLEATEFVLEKLEDLPMRCLHCMNDVFLGKGFYIPSKKYGSTRPALVKFVKSKAKEVMKNAKSSRVLPEVLDRAFRIVSLLSMERHGNDAGLSEHLDPLPEDLQALHDRILRALLRLQTLSFQELKVVYEKLAPNAEDRRDTSSNNEYRHPRRYRESVKSVLEEVLYRCGSIHTVPENVEEALDMISGPRNITLKKSAVIHLRHREKREMEALLNVSSELRNLSWEFIENSDLELEDGDYISVKKCKVDDETSTSRVEDDNQPEFHLGLGDDPLDHVDREITSVGDDGAAVAYEFTGRLMEEFHTGSQHPTKGYLCSGPGTSEQDDVIEPSGLGHEVDLVLKVATRIPLISESVLSRVRQRLMQPRRFSVDENIVS